VTSSAESSSIGAAKGMRSSVRFGWPDQPARAI